MIRIIALVAGPLSLVTQRKGIEAAEALRAWLEVYLAAGVRIIVPEIIDYEVRRELLRAGKSAGVSRLDSFIAAKSDRYLPITTGAMKTAARLWAESRNQGLPTADPHALDADVILAAQLLDLGVPQTDFVVVTTNVGHLSRFVPVTTWQSA